MAYPRLGQYGRCDPAHDTLASDVGCSTRTVRRATVAMRGLGLLHWRLRLVRNGWRTEQTSNAYRLCLDASVPVPACGGQNGREIHSKRLRASILGPQAEWEEILASRDRQLWALGYPVPAA